MKCRLFVFLLALLSVTGSAWAQEMDTRTSTVAAEDAAWCWFSDPRAVYHKEKKEAVYFGYINSEGDVMVRSLELRTNKMQEYTLHEKLQKDDHDVPSFLFLPDHRLLTFYCHHNGDIFMRKTVNPEDITSWEEERVILKKDSANFYCYMNPVMLRDEHNRIYLFGRNIVRRKNGINQPWGETGIYCIYSDDYGATWSKKANLLDNSGRNTPQYVKYATDNKSRIDFLFTNGHPKQGADISVHHMYYEKGAFFQTNGKKIGTLKDLPVLIRDVDKVYDPAAGKARSWIWDIALDAANRPVVTYARYPSETRHQYYYARWDGHQWNTKKIADAGPYMTIIKPGKKLLEAHYSGGIVLDHDNPGNIYLSRQINGKFEIEALKAEAAAQRISVTSRSVVDNIRPYAVSRGRGRTPVLFWMAGNYYHYTDFDTNLKMIR
ncbi:BNR-4 repeat-containing protein [Niabella beijingensis]|uniref:BNR-4 repeat-containing protein n=1 Tax=Niabella beijingensis TaxID=2872700 RepID=UPI001CBF2E30|nr:BNR-4 repeat-containing protein [Niabella beijingensis]MBZ4188613.1 BNR repeat-containing protein [Niabella beijingensis]